MLAEVRDFEQVISCALLCTAVPWAPVSNDEEVEVETEQLTESVDRVAALLGIARVTAYRAVRSGQIASIRIGRRYLVPREALRRLLLGDGPAHAPGEAADAQPAALATSHTRTQRA